MEDLLLNERFQHYEAFLTCIKRWLIDRANAAPVASEEFELHKFVGDGWILLFSGSTPGQALLDFMRALCAMTHAELTRHIIPNVSGVIPILGVTLGVEKGNLVKMIMNKQEEYVGRALNVACRLQDAVKAQDPLPAYKALVAGPLFNDLFGQSSVPYKVESATCPLRNILGGSSFACRKIDFTLDAAGQSIAWPELETSEWTCAASNWKKAS